MLVYLLKQKVLHFNTKNPLFSTNLEGKCSHKRDTNSPLPCSSNCNLFAKTLSNGIPNWFATWSTIEWNPPETRYTVTPLDANIEQSSLKGNNFRISRKFADSIHTRPYIQNSLFCSSFIAFGQTQPHQSRRSAFQRAVAKNDKSK